MFVRAVPFLQRLLRVSIVQYSGESDAAEARRALEDALLLSMAPPAPVAPPIKSSANSRTTIVGGAFKAFYDTNFAHSLKFSGDVLIEMEAEMLQFVERSASSGNDVTRETISEHWQQVNAATKKRRKNIFEE